MLCAKCGTELDDGSRFCRKCGAQVLKTVTGQTDVELEGLAISGDRQAFAELYNRHFEQVYDFLRRMLRDADEAADLAQETFLRAMRALSPKERKAAFSTWLFTIARNLALNRLERRHPTAESKEADEEPAVYEQIDPHRFADPEEAAQAQELSGLVWEAAAALNPKEYSLLDLHVRQGLDSAEIAEVLGVSKGNAYTMMSRLKDAFEGAVAAVVLIQRGRPQCDGLSRLLEEQSITVISPASRRLIDRHVAGCATCQERRRRLVSPAALFGALAAVPVPFGLKPRIAEALTASSAEAGAQAAGVGFRGLLSQSAARVASLSTAWKAAMVGGLLIGAIGAGVGGWVGVGGGLPGGDSGGGPHAVLPTPTTPTPFPSQSPVRSQLPSQGQSPTPNPGPRQTPSQGPGASVPTAAPTPQPPVSSPNPTLPPSPQPTVSSPNPTLPPPAAPNPTTVPTLPSLLPPATPGNLQVTPSQGLFTITWTDNSNNEDGFEITDNVTSRTVGPDTETYTWGGLAPNTYKCFKVRAYNSTGSSDWTPSTPPYYVCDSTPGSPPAAPSDLRVTPSQGLFTITWTDNSNNEDGFEITDNVTSRTVGPDTQTYTWDGLAPNTYMCFKVRAYNSTGSSDWTPSTPPYYLCDSTPGNPPGSPPAAPSNLRVTPSEGLFTLTWTDRSNNEDGFEIADCVPPLNQSGCTVDEKVGPDITQFTLSTPPNTYKCFSIRSFNAYGASDWSPDYVCDSTPGNPPVQT